MLDIALKKLGVNELLECECDPIAFSVCSAGYSVYFRECIVTGEIIGKILDHTLSSSQMHVICTNKTIQSQLRQIVFPNTITISSDIFENVYAYHSATQSDQMTCVYHDKLYMHPIWYVKHVYHYPITHAIPNCVLAIAQGDLTALTGCNLSDDTLKICIAFDQFEAILKMGHTISDAVIFHLIGQKDMKNVDMLLKHKVSLDVLNESGLSPIEYAMTIPDNINMIKLLHTITYTRHPKWWNYVLKLGIFEIPKQKQDVIVYQSIQGIHTISELNSILVTYYPTNAIKQRFISHNKKFFDTPTLQQEICDANNLELAELCKDLLPPSIWIELNQYHMLMNLDDVQLHQLTEFTITQNDARGLLFLCEYYKDKLKDLWYANMRTYLHIICQKSTYQLLQIALHYHPDLINVQDHQKCTPLYLVTRSADHIELLINKGASYNTTDINGNTYLHILAESGAVVLINKLVMMGLKLDYNARNMYGETPLILAAKNKHTETCNSLLANGADISLTDKIGNSAYHYIACYKMSYVKLTEFAHTTNIFGHDPTHFLGEGLLLNDKP
jgi:hypothetical protein